MVPWRELKKEHRKETFEKFKENKSIQWFAMASEVVLTTMGPEWWKKHLVESGEDDYFNTNEDNKSPAISQIRIIQFGDRLWRLKNIPGYIYFVESLRTQKLASALFELEAANALHKSGHKV